MKTGILAVLAGVAVFGASKSASPITVLSNAPTSAGSISTKTVMYSDRDIIRIDTQIRFTTLIVLPKEEQILDFVCGDKEFWVVSGSQNLANVKPAKEGAKTNLNLITASGNVYSFILSEGTGAPDLKVFVSLRDDELRTALDGAPRFVAASAVEDYRQQAELARAGQRRAEQDATARIAATQKAAAVERDRALDQHAGQINPNYRFKKERVFDVRGIYNDGRFTYILAKPREAPAVYEMKDGRPSLINFKYADGSYTLDKVVTSGYLAIGKKKLEFDEEERRR
jgi:type IV secretion system protein VirB9